MIATLWQPGDKLCTQGPQLVSVSGSACESSMCNLKHRLDSMQTSQAVALKCPDWALKVIQASHGGCPHVTISTLPGVQPKAAGDVVQHVQQGHAFVGSHISCQPPIRYESTSKHNDKGCTRSCMALLTIVLHVALVFKHAAHLSL